MKPFVLFLTFAATLDIASAQVLTRPTSAGSPGVPLTTPTGQRLANPTSVPNAPGYNAIAPAPGNLGNLGFGAYQNISGLNTLLFSNPSLILTNASGIPLDYREYAAVLFDLQRSMEQALPVVAALNQNLGLNGFQSFLPGPGVQAPPPTPATADAVTAPIPGTVMGAGANRPLAANANRTGALEPTGNPNPAGAPVLATTPPGLVNNPNTANANYRETFRALSILQADLERLLPLVAALNGNSNYLSGATGGTVTPSPVRGPAMQPGSTVLTPGTSTGALTPAGQ